MAWASTGLANAGPDVPGTVQAMTTIELAHMSDTHIGLTQYPVTSPTSGRNQREQDVSRAFVQVVESVNAWDPPLAIHSGDVAEKAIITYRHQRQIQSAIERMTVRKDGSPRLVIVISGNHDMPRDPREPCHLEPALKPLPSVVCVTNRYVQVDLDEYVDAGQASEELRGVVVHCLPHDQLKRDDWDEIAPVPGKLNILTSHGVVGGSELYKRSQGREYAIPIDVLLRDWDYVALGHYHKPGPVAVGGLKESSSYIYYAGSTENCGFSDLRDGVDGRGYLQVKVTAGELPEVNKVDLPIRAMFRLPVIDGAGLTYEQLTEELKRNARDAKLTGAVVDQKVINVHRDTWSLVDVAAARNTATDAMWYQVTPVFSNGLADGGETTAEQVERLGDLGVVLRDTADALINNDDEREQVLAMARSLLGSALSEGPATESGKGDETAGDIETGGGSDDAAKDQASSQPLTTEGAADASAA